MAELEYSVSNENLQAIISGLELNSEDSVLAVAGSGDQAFAILEYVKNVMAVDINPSQVSFMKLRRSALQRGDIGGFFQDDVSQKKEINFLGWQKRDTEFYRSRRREYFSAEGRFDRIKKKLGHLIIFPLDIFQATELKDGFTKIYLSNVFGQVYMGGDFDYWIPNLEKAFKRIAENLPKGGLIYTSFGPHCSYVSKELTIERNLTEKAKKFEAELPEWCQKWASPCVYRKI